MSGKTRIVGGLAAAIFLLAGICFAADATILAFCLLSLGLLILVVLVTVVHIQINKTTARSREVFRSGLRENRVLIKEIRNAEKLNSNRLRKDIANLSERLTIQIEELDSKLERLSLPAGKAEGGKDESDLPVVQAKGDHKLRRHWSLTLERTFMRLAGRVSKVAFLNNDREGASPGDVSAGESEHGPGNRNPGLEFATGSVMRERSVELGVSSKTHLQAPEAGHPRGSATSDASTALDASIDGRAERPADDLDLVENVAMGTPLQSAEKTVENLTSSRPRDEVDKVGEASTPFRSERRRGRKIRNNMDLKNQARRVVANSVQETIDASLNDDSAFEALTERIQKSHSPSGVNSRVLMVTSNGAGLGHLTRMAAVDRWLDSETLIYTMSSAYHRIGKPKDSIMYFPSHGDLGMNGRKWNVLMEENFSAVVKGFRPDVIVFDGTYVYRGVINVARKTATDLVWVQRGCWKADVDLRSKQRHDADKFCSSVIVPGDYGCSEAVIVGKSLEPNYVSPITLVQEEDLLTSQSARDALGLPSDKRLFLVQLGAGVINDIGDLRTQVVRAIQSLGDEWSPVLVRNPLSTHSLLPEVPSIQAYPLGKYYNAFEAGVFAAGYNTVQESVELGLPGLFIPNLETKTDDQVRRATGLESAGLGLKAVSVDGIQAAIRKLADQEFNSGIRSRIAAVRQTSGARQTAGLIESLIPSNQSKAAR